MHTTPRRRYRVRIELTQGGEPTHPYHMEELDPKRVRAEDALHLSMKGFDGEEGHFAFRDDKNFLSRQPNETEVDFQLRLGSKVFVETGPEEWMEFLFMDEQHGEGFAKHIKRCGFTLAELPPKPPTPPKTNKKKKKKGKPR